MLQARLGSFPRSINLRRNTGNGDLGPGNFWIELFPSRTDVTNQVIKRNYTDPPGVSQIWSQLLWNAGTYNRDDEQTCFESLFWRNILRRLWYFLYRDKSIQLCLSTCLCFTESNNDLLVLPGNKTRGYVSVAACLWSLRTGDPSTKDIRGPSTKN